MSVPKSSQSVAQLSLWRQLLWVSAGSKRRFSDRRFNKAPSGAFFVSEGCGVNGTYKRSRNHRALALSVLGGIGLTALAFPALAASNPGQGVSVTVNPTTGYAVINSSTVGTPRGTTVGPSGGVPSVNVRPAGAGGGFSQSLPAGIEITGLRQNAQTLRGPLGATLNASLGAVKNGAVRCLTSFRCTTALGLGSMGLQALLENMNWDLDPTGWPLKNEQQLHEEPPPGSTIGNMQIHESWRCTESWTGPPPLDTGLGTTFVGCANGGPYPQTRGGQARCGGLIGTEVNGSYLVGWNIPSRQCFYMPTPAPIISTPATPSEVSDAVDQHYSPDPSDWNWLTGGLDFTRPDVTIDITEVPVLDGSNEPNFIEWSDGTSRGTFNTYTPTVTNNGSHKPEISVKDEQTEITYDEQGNPTGSSTSTTVTGPSTSTGGGGAPAAEVPTDCDFMPTVCRFIDWFTEPEPLPDPDQEIRDLVQVYEDGGRQVDLGPSVGACPPPRTIALSFVPAVEVSFQPFCDLAAAVRYWLLAIASFGAAYLTVRSI